MLIKRIRVHQWNPCYPCAKKISLISLICIQKIICVICVICGKLKNPYVNIREIRAIRVRKQNLC